MVILTSSMKYARNWPLSGGNGVLVCVWHFRQFFIFRPLILIRLFSLTVWPLSRALVCCALSGILSVAVSLLLVSFSHNRVEGMAVSKLSGIIMLGLPVPFFLSSGAQYLFSPLPSFWIAKVCLENSILFAFPALFTSLIWTWALWRRFRKKLT